MPTPAADRQRKCRELKRRMAERDGNEQEIKTNLVVLNDPTNVGTLASVAHNHDQEHDLSWDVRDTHMDTSTQSFEPSGSDYMVDEDYETSINMMMSISIEDEAHLNISRISTISNISGLNSSSTNGSLPADMSPNISGENLNDGIIEDLLENNEVTTSFKQQLIEWILENLDSLRLNVVSKLLIILRREGYNLPKTCQTLIGTKHLRKTQLMLDSTKSSGQYIYLGIETNLKKIIDPKIYDEDSIQIFIHIDGMQLFRSSRRSVWPIIMKLHHPNYYSKPVVIALFSGNCKPNDVEEYLFDFVSEASQLTTNGVTIVDKKYSFQILAIIADSPARAFLKNCKGHTAFYACERCVTKGISVGEHRHKLRVFPEMDAEKRTKESFLSQSQPEHHKGQTPLIRIPNFDPVEMVVLDSMHLLYSGVMKWLLDKWTDRKSPQRLRKQDIAQIQILMNGISSDVPLEFQRKKFDMFSTSNWKATQFRFFLHYSGPIVLKNILPDQQYAHFLLLYVACRILNNKKLMLHNVDEAAALLRDFFYVLPTLYGEKSQTLGMHNLLHAPDDARNLLLPLSEFSAFWGENYIAIFKKLVKSPLKPLTQIANRLDERESGDRMKIQRKVLVQRVKLDDSSDGLDHNEGNIVSSLQLSGMTLKSIHPNNCVMLKNGNIFVINKILVRRTTNQQLKDFCIQGCESKKLLKVFDHPVSSTDIGLVEILKWSRREKQIQLNEIAIKCVLFQMINRQYATSFLHEFHFV